MKNLWSWQDHDQSSKWTVSRGGNLCPKGEPHMCKHDKLVIRKVEREGTFFLCMPEWQESNLSKPSWQACRVSPSTDLPWWKETWQHLPKWQNLELFDMVVSLLKIPCMNVTVYPWNDVQIRLQHYSTAKFQPSTGQPNSHQLIG